ncbi:uncharacterized protein VTP21DRAFT_9277 [Calcarisporiella thermophila]|uniref:uncharacterized protein n=1 Tax=Calcarisporiella thermophila TaxID=911321 RepID=UPI003741E989
MTDPLPLVHSPSSSDSVSRPGSAPPPETEDADSSPQLRGARGRKRSQTADGDRPPKGRRRILANDPTNGVNAELLCLEQILEEARRDELAAGNVPSTDARHTRPVDDDFSDEDIGEVNIFPVNESNPLSMELLSRARRKRTRTITTPYQTRVLRKVLALTAFPSTQMRRMLAEALNMSPRTVQIWYQNRRQKEKSRQAAQRNHVPPEGRGAAEANKEAPHHHQHQQHQQQGTFFHNVTIVQGQREELPPGHPSPHEVKVERNVTPPASLPTPASALPNMSFQRYSEAPSQGPTPPMKSYMMTMPIRNWPPPSWHNSSNPKLMAQSEPQMQVKEHDQPLDILAMAALDRARMDVPETPSPSGSSASSSSSSSASSSSASIAGGESGEPVQSSQKAENRSGSPSRWRPW